MSETSLNILIIEREARDFSTLDAFLNNNGINARSRHIDSSKSFENAMVDNWDIVLLGSLPADMSTAALLQTLHIHHPLTPLVVLHDSVDVNLEAVDTAIHPNTHILHNDLSELLQVIKRTTDGDEFSLARKDSERRIKSASGLLQDEQRRARLAALNMMEDAIAARKRAEAAYNSLKQSEERHRSVLENAADAVFIANSDGEYTYVNQKACELLGYPSEKLLSMSIPDIFSDTEAVRALQGFEQLKQKGHLLIELNLLASNGKEIPVEVNAIQLPDGTFYGAARDISERKEAEAYLKQSAAVFESSRDAIMVTDAHGIIVALNPAFTEITGYQESEAVGRNTRFLRSDHHDRTFYQRLWNSLSQYDGWSGEIWNRHKDGQIYPAWLSLSTVRDENHNVTSYIGILSDLTRLKRSEEELEHLATHDPLTGLPNGRLLESRIEHAITQARRHQHGIAVMMLDIDRFKDINDSLGLNAGDQLIKEMAGRVVSSVWDSDTVARIGGDELVVIVEEINDPEIAARIADKLRQALSAPYTIDSQNFYLTTSIGISYYPDNGDSAELLIRNADAAVYRAKDEGRNRVSFYSEDLSRSAMERLSLETELREALEHQQLELHYQPQIYLETKKLAGVEALVRWRHPEKGLIPPNKFIPVAETTGLIESIGEWVFAEACRQKCLWRKAGVDVPRIAVNLSAKQLGRGELIDAIRKTLALNDIAEGEIELELTETAIMHDPGKAAETLEAIACLGIEMAVDDFGTGYSSLAYLQRLNMNRLKIDQGFVRDIPDNKNNAAICRTIIAMANSLGMETIAEGIEELQQKDYLESEMCTIGQGWFYAKAMPAAELEKWLEQFNREA